MCSGQAIFFSSFTNRIWHKYNQARETKLQASIDKHVGDNKVLTITVAEMHAKVSAFDDSLKEQRMKYDDALTKQHMELIQEYEDKLTTSKIINIACQVPIRTYVRPHHMTTAE